MSKLLFERYREHRHTELARQHKVALATHDLPQIMAHEASTALFDAALVKTEKVLFSHSAMMMLYDILDHKWNTQDYDARISAVHDIWIEFPEPFAVTGYSHVNINAMHFVRLYDPALIGTLSKRLAEGLLESNKTLEYLYALDCIDLNGDPVFSLIWHPEHGWNFSEFHDCPFEECRYVGKQLIPCDKCQRMKTYWSLAFMIALSMKEQFYAEEKTETYTTLRRIPRKDNPKKYRTTEMKHVFHVIDASTKIVREPQEPSETRGSWLALHTPDEIAYVDKRIKRTYRHERYKNVKGTTVDITQHRPVLKDHEAKRVTKVVASEYEEYS